MSADAEAVDVWGVGPPAASLMLVGEAWGENEEREGRPFVGRSGDELTRYLAHIGIQRESVYVTNLCNERPPGNADPTPQMIARHEARLIRELETVRPRYVVTLGRYSTHWFLPGIDTRRLMDRTWGLPFAATRGSWSGTVISIHHPAFGLYSPDEQNRIERGFEMLAAVIEGRSPAHRPADQYPNPYYRELTDEDDIYSVVGIDPVIAIDTEGSISHPWCLSFSTRAGTGYVIRASQHRAIAQLSDWIADRNPLVVCHYLAHDLPVLDALGLARPRRLADSMLIQYLLGPHYAQALKLAAYRELGMEMRDYEDLTAEADRALAVAYLESVLDAGRCPVCRGRGQRVEKTEAHVVPAHRKQVTTKSGPVWRQMREKRVPADYRLVRCEECDGDGTRWPKLRALTLWENGSLTTWQPSAVGARVRRILADVSAGKCNKDGEPTDPRERWEGADPPEAIAPVISELGHMPAATLDMVPLIEAIAYAACDADATLRLWTLKDPMLDTWGLRDVYDTDIAVIPMLVEMQQTGMRVDTAYFRDLCMEYDRELARTRHQIQRLVGYYVNPASSKQVANLLFVRLGLPPVKLTKSKESESTADKVLEQLSLTTHHPVIPLLQHHREIHKLRGTYGEPLSRVDTEDSRVHMLLNYTRTDTGRIASSKPRRGRDKHNWIQGQNIPTRTEEGRRILAGFVEDEGYLIHNYDLSQIEWRVLAHLSKDENLTGVFERGEDMHLRTAALIYEIEIEAVSKDQRQDAKNVGFGMGYRITYRGLREQFAQRGVEITDEGAQEFITKYLAAYPGIPRMWQRIEMEARRKGYVRSPSGRIRWVAAVRSRAPWVRAEAERAACNFPVQEYAAYLMKKLMIYVDTRVLPAMRGSGFDVRPLLTIHDSLMLRVPDGAEAILDPLMRRAMREIGESAMQGAGLRVPVRGEGSWGRSWAEAKG
jgi:uracil-DNA glycosylase family 4